MNADEAFEEFTEKNKPTDIFSQEIANIIAESFLYLEAEEQRRKNGGETDGRDTLERSHNLAKALISTIAEHKPTMAEAILATGYLATLTYSQAIIGSKKVEEALKEAEEIEGKINHIKQEGKEKQNGE